MPVQVSALSFVPPAASRPTLCGIDLRLRRGECTLLTGPTGSGKSTLLRAIAGILPPGGRTTGRVAVEGRPALMFQNVETQLLFTTVDEEVASGLRWRGVAPERLSARVTEMLGQVGLAGFERRAVEALSAGEKQRVVLAALLALEPAVVLLDEPTSALDRCGRERLVQILSALKRGGHTILIADHLAHPFRDLADHHWSLKEGRLIDAPIWSAAASAQLPAPPSPVSPPSEVLRCDSLAVRDAGGRVLLENVSLQLRRGERVLVTGPNGSGKTTLLRAVAGLVTPSEGRIAVARRDRFESGSARGGVGLLFQNPQLNLFERTAGDEVAFALHRKGLPAEAVRRRVAEVLDLCGLAPHRDRSPLRLSFGEQHRVALASVLAPEPDLLLLDEPFAGFDPESRVRLLELLAREQERSRIAILLTSHDEHPLSSWTHRCVRLEHGGMRYG